MSRGVLLTELILTEFRIIGNVVLSKKMKRPRSLGGSVLTQANPKISPNLGKTTMSTINLFVFSTNSARLELTNIGSFEIVYSGDPPTEILRP